MREDLELREYAKQLGFTEELSAADRYADRSDIPHDAIQFIKGDAHVWYCRLGWQTADLTGDGSGEAVTYRNHKPYKTLKEALEKKGGADA